LKLKRAWNWIGNPGIIKRGGIEFGREKIDWKKIKTF